MTTETKDQTSPLNPEDFDLDEIDATLKAKRGGGGGGFSTTVKNKAILDIIRGGKGYAEVAKGLINPSNEKPVQVHTVRRWVKDFRDKVAEMKAKKDGKPADAAKPADDAAKPADDAAKPATGGAKK